MEGQNKTFNPACKANACPLQVSVVTNCYEPESKKDPRLPRWGVCEYHNTHDGRHWSAITRMIQQNIKIIRLYQAVQALTDARVKALPGERVTDWLVRYGDVIEATVLPKSTPSADIPNDKWQAVYELLSTPRTTQ